MIKHIYYRHHERHEETHQDNKLISVLSSIIHTFDSGEEAFESLTLNDGTGTVLTEIEDIEWMYKRLQEEGAKDRQEGKQ